MDTLVPVTLIFVIITLLGLFRPQVEAWMEDVEDKIEEITK